ncbi:hypothetical protein H5410_034467 [Solanum commersonii]|uniref:Uncharacterized protein n=1 Tax=Solanum commersonii TaxID=4109 RepID=A0A9J5YRG9_SOLCO|nr:hypothetical protein H5410_034467 [Solanum commersonii]
MQPTIKTLDYREISRCILRYNVRFLFESAKAEASRLGSKGLEKDELRKIPVIDQRRCYVQEK